TRFSRDWSSDVCSSDLAEPGPAGPGLPSADAEGEVLGVDLVVGTVFDDLGQGLVQALAQRITLAHGDTDLVVVEYRLTLELEVEIGRASCRGRRVRWGR